MDVGIIFYDIKTHRIGETFALDGNNMVAKFLIYDYKTNLLLDTKYEVIAEDNKIFTKKKIIDYLNKLNENLNEKIVELDTKLLDKGNKYILDNIKNESKNIQLANEEIQNILKHQEVEPTETRTHQIKCLNKYIRKCLKNIKKIEYYNQELFKQRKMLLLKIKKNESLINYVKGI